jgi:hypothetical protein
MPRILQCRDASLIKQADRYHNHASTILDRSVKHARIYLAELDGFVDGFMQSGTRVFPLIQNIMDQKSQLQHVTRSEPPAVDAIVR